MTNQKRGSGERYAAVRSKWRPAPRKAKPKRDEAEAVTDDGKTGRRGRGAVGRGRGAPARGLRGRGAAGWGSAEPTSEPESPPRPERPKGPPGAQPINQCVAAFQALKLKALGYPGAYEDHAEGRTLVKLKNKKVILALGREGGGLTITCRLVRSGARAVSTFSFASAAASGLGKRGWVTGRFERDAEVPTRMLLGWVEESLSCSSLP